MNTIEDLRIFSNRVCEAAVLIQGAHKDQFRKDGKTPFYTHPFAVAKLVQEFVSEDDDVLLISALAHDCVEDIEDFDLDDFVNKLYGDDDKFKKDKTRIKDIVLALTKNNTFETRHERNLDNYVRISNCGMDAILIKLCDRFHNVSDMEGMTHPFQLRYLMETQFLLGYFSGSRSEQIYKNLVKLTDNRMMKLYDIIKVKRDV